MSAQTVTLKDGRSFKLGRIKPKAPPPCLRFAAYYDPFRDVTPPPAVVDYAAKAMDAMKRVYLNDQYGDCVIAGKYHQLGIWSGNAVGTPVLATDDEVLNSYHSICGPGDNGCVITDVLDVFKSSGLIANGQKHKIDGYVAVDNTNKLEVMVALDVFGSLTLGIDLPGDWTCTNCTWDVTHAGTVGGHDVCAVGYNEQGVQICTWGGIVTITWPAFLARTWITELYAQLSPDWYSKGNLAPNGIDAATLAADLAKLGGGIIPDPGPGPNPPPAPPPPPPPPVPVPIPFSIPVPQQPVYVGPFPIGHVPAYTLAGQIGHVGHQPAQAILPWLIPVLKALCPFAPNLPAPWNALAGVVCGIVSNQPAAKPCGCKEQLPAVTPVFWS